MKKKYTKILSGLLLALFVGLVINGAEETTKKASGWRARLAQLKEQTGKTLSPKVQEEIKKQADKAVSFAGKVTNLGLNTIIPALRLVLKNAIESLSNSMYENALKAVVIAAEKTGMSKDEATNFANEILNTLKTQSEELQERFINNVINRVRKIFSLRRSLPQAEEETEMIEMSEMKER